MIRSVVDEPTASVTVPWRPFRRDPRLQTVPGPAKQLEGPMEARTEELADRVANAPVPTREQIEETRRAYAARMFDLITEPVMIQSLRRLLKHRDVKTRCEMWKTVLTYLMPLPLGPGGNPYPGEGPAVNINVVNHVDRPGQTRVQVSDAGEGSRTD